MRQAITHVTLVVPDYEAAISFYVGVLNFTLVEDVAQPQETKRWVVIAPPGGCGASLVLGRASTPAQEAAVGNQAGGRVFLFLGTDAFERDYAVMQAKGVAFVRPPQTHDYGTVAVFSDPFGNLWDLVEFAPGHPMAL